MTLCVCVSSTESEGGRAFVCVILSTTYFFPLMCKSYLHVSELCKLSADLHKLFIALYSTVLEMLNKNRKFLSRVSAFFIMCLILLFH